MDRPPQTQHRRLQRFARMGLGANPFGVLARDQLAGLYVAPGDGDASADALMRSSVPIVQIIAERGRGKSMVLAAVEAKLAASQVRCHYLYCPPDAAVRFDPPAAAVRVVLLDEAQRLRPRCLRRARLWQQESAGRIIAATHDDLTAHFGPQTLTLTLPRADATIIAQVFRRRVEAAGGAAARIQLADRAAAWLARHADGDLRWVEMLCYEAFQSIEPAEEITIDVPLLERLREALQWSV